MMTIGRVIESAFLSLLLCGASVLSAHAAGQVVTSETREWAKKTIADEKALAAAPASNALVVLYFVNRTGRVELNPLQKGMTLMLLTDLAQVPDLQLVERVKLQALTEELGLGSSGLVEQSTAPRVAQLVGARWISGGDFSGAQKERFDTQSRLVDVQASVAAGQFAVAGTLDDILKTEKELVFKIVDLLKISLKPEVTAAIRKPCSRNRQALDSLFQGVDASDRGDYQRAGDLYNEAMKADPNVCVASDALNELMRMGIYSRKRGGSLTRTSQKPVENGSIITYTVTTDIGYSATVTGCGGSLDGSTYTTGPITGPCTVSATFNIIRYTVTGTAGANGNVTPASQQVDHGSFTTFKVTPDKGYTALVTGCGGSLKGSTYTTGQITAECRISATFTPTTPPALTP